MSFIKYILIILLFIFFSKSSLADVETANTHEGGIQITGYYSYDEPYFMYNRSKSGEHLLDNFGLIYNFKHQRLINDYLYEFEVDTDYKRIRYDYWSEATGTDNDIVNEIKNIRLLGGIPLSENIKLKIGIGYRYLKDRHGFKKTSFNSLKNCLFYGLFRKGRFQESDDASHKERYEQKNGFLKKDQLFQSNFYE